MSKSCSSTLANTHTHAMSSDDWVRPSRNHSYLLLHHGTYGSPNRATNTWGHSPRGSSDNPKGKGQGLPRETNHGNRTALGERVSYDVTVQQPLPLRRGKPGIRKRAPLEVHISSSYDAGTILRSCYSQGSSGQTTTWETL